MVGDDRVTPGPAELGEDEAAELGEAHLSTVGARPRAGRTTLLGSVTVDTTGDFGLDSPLWTVAVVLVLLTTIGALVYRLWSNRNR